MTNYNIYRVTYFYSARCGRDTTSEISDKATVRVIARDFVRAIKGAKQQCKEEWNIPETDEHDHKTGRHYNMCHFEVDSVEKEKDGEVWL